MVLSSRLLIKNKGAIWLPFMLKNMAGTIHVVNINTNDYSNYPNYYYIGHSKNGNPLSNPFRYTGKNSRKNLTFKTREETVDAYRQYFKLVYNKRGYESLTNAFNEIYEHYKAGQDIYLACFCSPLPCHGDVLKEELEKKLIREKIVQSKLKKTDFQT